MIDQFLDLQNSLDTRRTYAKGIRRFLAFIGKPIEEATTEDVIRWKTDLAGSDLAPRSQWTYFCGARSLMDWLAKMTAITSNPFLPVPMPRRIKNSEPYIPTADIIEDMLASVDWTPSWRGARDTAIITTMMCGLRISEVAGLSLGDIESDERMMLRVVGKGQKERHVPVRSRCQNTISFWLANRPFQDADPLFTDYDGNRMTRRQVEFVVEKARTDKKVHAHTLRHVFATDLIRAGASLPAVQDLLGHENIQTTMTYVHMQHDDLVRAVDLLEPPQEVRIVA